MQVYTPQSYTRNENRVGKALKRWLVYLILLALVGLGIYWYLKFKGKEFDVRLIATKGTVEFRQNEQDSWKPAESLPLEIKSSTEVRTVNDSAAEIEMPNNGKIRLSSFARIVLTKNQGRVNWVQTDGNIHYQVLPNPDRKEYKVAISEGEIIASGTAFEIKIRPTAN